MFQYRKRDKYVITSSIPLKNVPLLRDENMLNTFTYKVLVTKIQKPVEEKTHEKFWILFYTSYIFLLHWITYHDQTCVYIIFECP